jgi:hypothetical protein
LLFSCATFAESFFRVIFPSTICLSISVTYDRKPFSLPVWMSTFALKYLSTSFELNTFRRSSRTRECRFCTVVDSRILARAMSVHDGESQLCYYLRRRHVVATSLQHSSGYVLQRLPQPRHAPSPAVLLPLDASRTEKAYCLRVSACCC